MGARAAVVPSLLLAAATLGCNPETRSGPAAAAAKPDSGDTFVFRPAAGHEVFLRPIDGRGDVARTALPPTGAFQTQPAADGDAVIRAFVDDLVVVSGARFSPERPEDQLKVEVEWGDGRRSETGCGPCRVEHFYRPGRYELTATIHDRRLADRGSVTQTFTVFVQGPAEPAPTALPPNCRAITKPNGACPTGATTFCVSDPVVVPTNPAHALAACNTCFGGASCSNFNVTCFGSPTTTFQASASLSALTAGFVYNRTSASGALPGEIADFLLPSCPAGGTWGL